MNLFALELFYNRADFNYLINYELKESKKKNVTHIYMWTPQAFLLWLHSVSYFIPHFCEK